MAVFDRKLDFLQVKFRDLVGLSKAEQTAQLLDRLQTIFDMSIERSFMNKHGDETPNPDLNAAAKVIDCAAKLTVFAENGSGVDALALDKKPSVTAISEAAQKLQEGRKKSAA